MRSLSIESTGTVWRALRRVVPISFALALTLTFGTADAWAKGNQAPPAIAAPASSTSADDAGALLEELAMPFHLLFGAPDDDLAEYAQREAAAAALEDFHGGDVIVIGGTGLALVLLVVLIIVLL